MNDSTLVQPVEQPTVRTRLFYTASIATLFLAGILTLFLIFNFFEQNRQTQAIDEATEKTNQLVEEVKTLAEQNKALSQSAANYAYCNAVIQAKATQTRDVITIEDLNECVLNSFPDGQGAPTNSGSQQTIVQPSSPAPSNPTQPSNPVTPTPTPTNPSTGGNTGGSGGVKTTPRGILPGVELTLPCITIPNILGVCR